MSFVEQPVLDVSGLSVTLSGGAETIVRDVSFYLRPTEILGVMGESGCGKSMLAWSLLRMNPQGTTLSASKLSLGDADMLSAGEAQLYRLRGRRIGLVPQNVATALCPDLSIAAQARRLDRLNGGADREARLMALLRALDLDPAAVLGARPQKLSGGMQQRVLLALAAMRKPSVIIADEPTSQLDPDSSSRCVETLRQQAGNGTAILLISHSFEIVARTAVRVMVMYAGRIVESGGAADVLERPLHPYTQALRAAEREISSGELHRVATRPDVSQWDDSPPAIGSSSAGCEFSTRCPHAFAHCWTDRPALEDVGVQRQVACHIAKGAGALATDLDRK